MLKIGDFAGITGLSAKALRHYDEKSVIVPEVVDGRSGYRLYAESQVRSGVIVRALRAAGVPLHAVSAVNDERSALTALEAHREQVLADRLEEDRAYFAAGSELRALAAPVPVECLRRNEQKYVGRLLSVSLAALDELSNDVANDEFAELYERLSRIGAQVSGNFWTTMRMGENGEAEVIGCWEVLSFPDSSLLGEGDIAGSLHVRTDLVATWRPTEGEELPDGATHPAVVALFDALDERQTELQGKQTEIRQAVLGSSESDFAVEVSISLPSN